MPADQSSSCTPRPAHNFANNIMDMNPQGRRHPHCNKWPQRMPSTLFRSLLAFTLASCALLSARQASAQTGGTTTSAGGASGTTTLVVGDFSYYFEKYVNGQWVQMNSQDQQYFFNRARCECDTAKEAEVKILIVANSGTYQKISAALRNTLISTDGSGRLYASANGINCLSPTSYIGGVSGSCTNLLDPGTYAADFKMSTFLSQNRWESPAFPVAWLFNSLTSTCGGTSGNSCDATTNCATQGSNATIYFWAQTTTNAYPDFSDAAFGTVSLVGTVSASPDTISAEGGNEALNVSWTWPAGTTPSATSFSGVQLFCQRGADLQVFKDGWFSPSFKTASSLCGADAPASSSSGPFAGLNPLYLCSGLIPAGTTSHRISGLQNGIPYGVGIAAVDRFGNVGDVVGPVYATPIPTVDFYTNYRDDHGAATGGFCMLDRWHKRSGAMTVLGLLGLGIVVGLRRRRRRGPPGAGTLLLVLMAGTLASSPATAESSYLGNSFSEGQPSEVWKGSPRQFAIEARFGLYTPAVDAEFSGNGAPQPQSFIFGKKKRPMWQMEFDWEFMQAFGTLAVGGVIGYYKENAYACKQVELVATGICERSGDNTSLRLIPLAALLVYRMDQAAQEWKIPLVPYGKIGLNYTIWTVNDGDGNVPTYAGGGRGQGGTMGWQATVGLSLMLDFLDPGAARGFDADAGVNHSYAFFELTHIDASGLGQGNRLHVGDNTWFTGLMFEF